MHLDPNDPLQLTINYITAPQIIANHKKSFTAFFTVELVTCPPRCAMSEIESEYLMRTIRLIQIPWASQPTSAAAWWSIFTWTVPVHENFSSQWNFDWYDHHPVAFPGTLTLTWSNPTYDLLCESSGKIWLVPLLLLLISTDVVVDQ